ncbi:MAG: ACP S-malonyltransferase [Alphaproteobacteria bacterium]
MTRAFIFPGQGSQYPGMGRELVENFIEAREVFEEVDEALGQALSRIVFEGSESDLNFTENTQPALMAVSMAIVRVLQKQGGINLAKSIAFLAGHSLGEYAALTAAGAISLSDTAKLLKLRGQSMQKAVPVGVGAMAAILGLDLKPVQQIVQEVTGKDICQVANDNSPGQVVISGHKAGVEAGMALAQQKGAKRAILLPVSAPFHCALMQPAADIMAQTLAATKINNPVVPVVSNVTAQGVRDAQQIPALLTQQITGMVRWRESVLWMREQGVEEMIELGAGKVLSGMVRRIDKDIACESVEGPAQIEALIQKLERG